MMTDVYLVTATDMPKVDLETEALQSTLMEMNISTEIVIWDDVDVKWNECRLCIIRTPWDYYSKREQFYKWMKDVNDVTTLWNPLAIMLWNIHKKYLIELNEQGVPIVPTKLVIQGAKTTLQNVLNNSNSEEIIIKPAISCGAIGAGRFKYNDKKAEEHFQKYIRNEDVLVQPFIKDILDTGEISLIYFFGEFSHAVRKIAKKGDYRVQDDFGGTVEKYNANENEIEIGQKALNTLNEILPYARVDMVITNNGPLLMELELIEPQLFFHPHTDKLFTFAKLIEKQLLKN